MSLMHRCARVAAPLFVLAALVPGARAADANITYTNSNELIVQPTGTGSGTTAPSGYRTWTSSTAGVQVNYTYNTCPSPGSCVDIQITNTTNAIQSYGMLANQPWTPSSGENYRLQAKISVFNAGGRSTIIGVGYESWGTPGSGLTDGPMSVVEQSLLNTPQVATSYLTANTTADKYGQVLTDMQPRLKVYNIPALATVSLRLHSLSLKKTTLPGTWIRPLSTLQSILPSYGSLARPFRVAVNLFAQNGIAGYQSNLRLVLSGGTTTINYGTRAVINGLSSNSGTGSLQDSWNGLAAPTGPGTYDVYYRLIPNSSSPAATLTPSDPSVVGSPDGAGGTQYKIGQIKVDWASTMEIGNTFHSLHPATSAPVNHEFVRSLGHAKTSLDNWWRIDPITQEPVMAWDEGNQNFPQWVVGVSGFIRKAVITFYGMRPEIAAYPHEGGAWGIPGIVSAPTEAGLVTYTKVIQKTVDKFKGSLYAVECWNEPDSTGHYVGSQTQLADMCKRVYQATKAADPNNYIKIICPQASSPAAIGYVLGARTSENEPITNYCDMIGTHLYGYTGTDAQGKAYSLNSLATALRELKFRASKFPGAANKAIAATEFGVHDCLWNSEYTQAHPATSVQTSNTVKADIVYQSLLTLKEYGVKAVALYSYDNPRVEHYGACPIYGGYSWQYDADTSSAIQPVIDKIGNAVTDF